MGNLRDFLARRYFDTPLSSWLVALALAGALSVGLGMARRLALNRVGRRVALRPESRADAVLASALASLRSWFFVAVGLWLASEQVSFVGEPRRWLRTGVSLLTLCQIGLSLQSGIRTLSQGWGSGDDAGEAKMAASATAFLASVAIWAILIVSGLSMLGFEISALVAGLGVGGVAAALAVQNILGDLLASLSIYFDRPFQIGDFVVVGEEMGTVERIGLRTTRLRSLGGEELVLANGDLAKSRLRNFKRMTERRVVFGFGVEYGTPPEQLQEIPNLVRSIIEARPATRFDRVHFKELGDFALNFEVVFYVLSADYTAYMDERQAINLELCRRFDERRIQFAFPTQKLLLFRAEGADPDAKRSRVPIHSAPARSPA